MPSVIVRSAPAIFIMGGIFFLSHQPGDLFAPYDFRWADKLAHLTVYALLCFALIYAFTAQYRRSARGLVAGVSLLICLFYGISDEFHQSFVPGRDPSVSDVAADFLGALLACILWSWWSKHSHTGRVEKRG